MTLTAIIAAHSLLLPATIDWAAAHGLWGWTLWLVWATGSLAALHRGVRNRRPRTGVPGYVHVLNAAAVAGIGMAVAAPGGWVQALSATAGTAVIWLIAYVAYRTRSSSPRTHHVRTPADQERTGPIR